MNNSRKKIEKSLIKNLNRTPLWNRKETDIDLITILSAISGFLLGMYIQIQFTVNLFENGMPLLGKRELLNILNVYRPGPSIRYSASSFFVFFPLMGLCLGILLPVLVRKILKK